MAKWIQKKEQLAKKASQNLKDRQVYEAMLKQAGLPLKENKGDTALQRISSGLGAFEWSDDLLKTFKQGGSFTDFAKSYLADIPKTVAGAIINKPEWTQAGEGKGSELMKYLGVDNKAARFAGGLAADILTPDMLISGVVGKGEKIATSTGKELIEKIGKAEGDDALRLIAEHFGDDAAKWAEKSMASGATDFTAIAKDLVNSADEAKGLTRALDKGLYLGYSPEKGIKIADGRLAGYFGRAIENPLMAPFQIGKDIVKSSDVLSKVADTIGEKTGIKKLSEALDWSKGVDKNSKLYEGMTQMHGAKEAASYAAGKSMEKMGDLISKLRKADPEGFAQIEKGLNRIVESGAQIAEDTTLEQWIKSARKDHLIGMDSAKEALSNLKKLEELKPGISKTTFGEMTSKMGTLGDMLEPIKRVVGEDIAPKLEGRVQLIKESQKQWGDFLRSIGVNEPLQIKKLADVERLKNAIDNSSLTQELKDLYNSSIVDLYKSNLAMNPLRKKVGVNTFGVGYAPRSYKDIEKEVPLGISGKATPLNRRQRVFPTIVDVDLFNKFSTDKYVMDTSAEALIKQYGSKAQQDYVVKFLHGQYTNLVQQVKAGLIDGFTLKGDAPASYIVPKIGDKSIPMLSRAGVRVDPKVWDLYYDSMKYVTGQSDLGDALKIFRQANGMWRGITTAFSVKLGPVEIPLNPSFYFRNFLNNKLSAILYGGVDPIKLPTRYMEGRELYKFIKEGEGAGKMVGDFKIEELAKEFLRNGGMGGTNAQDVLNDIGTKFTDKLKNLKGSGDLAESVEVTDKLAVFIDARMRGMGATEAMNKVRASLFDYGQLTDFEARYLKPVMAFYTWNKKNLEALITTLASDPKKVGVFDDVFTSLQAFSDENNVDMNEILPDYLQGAYQIRFGGGKSVGAIYGFGTNLEAVNSIIGRDLKGTGENMISNLAPIPRMPLELATGFNAFKGQKIEDDNSAYAFRNLPESMRNLMGIREEEFTTKDGKKVLNYKMDPTVKYLVENVRPITGAANIANAITNEGMKGEGIYDWLNYLSGIKYKQYDLEYSKAKAESERYKDAMERLTNAGYVSKFQKYYLNKKRK